MSMEDNEPHETPVPEYIKGCEHGFLFPQYCAWCNGTPIPKVDLTGVYEAAKTEPSL